MSHNPDNLLDQPIVFADYQITVNGEPFGLVADRVTVALDPEAPAGAAPLYHVTRKRSAQAPSFTAGIAHSWCGSVASDAAGLVESLNACGAGVRPGLSSRQPAVKQEPLDVSPRIPVVHGREDVKLPTLRRVETEAQ